MQPYDPVPAFLQESHDLLAEIETAALDLREGAAAGDLVHSLFRAFHTIKGSGAMAGLQRTAAFTHHVETLLDAIRSGALPLEASHGDLLLRSADLIRQLLDAERGGAPVSESALETLVAELCAPLSQAPAAPAPAAPAPSAPAGPLERFRFRLVPKPHFLHCGARPELLFSELAGLGELRLEANLEQLPSLADLDPTHLHLSWSGEIETSAGLNALKDVFIFVEDDCSLTFEPLAPAATQAAPEATLETAPPARAVEPVSSSSVRVPAERLDRLVNLVGELVMNQLRLAGVAGHLAHPELDAPVEAIERLVQQLREEVLGIRMMPIGSIFGRFRRLVADLSLELGKQIDLEMSGADTELDKTILDRLGEPLIHLLRNSIDHGIEDPADRVAAGKPAAGRILLSATHKGSDVVIRVEDDGRGMNRQRIREKALERRLIAADEALDDARLLQLVLQPGFSTAREVTSISGRGVGMDAVKRQIDALRGNLTLTSAEGQGTAFTITVPLTLAIIEGLLVEVGGTRMIVPMAAVQETVELARSERLRRNGRNTFALRGDLLSYMDLRALLAMPGEEPPLSRIVIVRAGAQRVGLLVDRVLGTHQTVLQSLGRFFERIEVVSGSTVMGDGHVALVLDIAGLVRFAARHAAPVSPLPRSGGQGAAA